MLGLVLHLDIRSLVGLTTLDGRENPRYDGNMLWCVRLEMPWVIVSLLIPEVGSNPKARMAGTFMSSGRTIERRVRLVINCMMRIEMSQLVTSSCLGDT